MIDLDITRRRLLSIIQSSTVAGPRRREGSDERLDPITDASDPRAHLSKDVHLLVRGQRKELFPLLELVLSQRFAGVPRPALIWDLLAPLKNALGNAHKHGNARDPARWISAEIRLAAGGALIAISDEGDGFEVAREVLRFREGARDGERRGAGFRTFERARALVTYEKGGRTVLLCYQPEPGAGQAAPPSPLAGDAAFQRLSDAQWMQSCLCAELPELQQGSARLEACRVYSRAANASEGFRIRYLLRIAAPASERHETRILAGRLHADEGAAEADFQAASQLRQQHRSRCLRIPAPVARLRAEPRFVLHDFHPWMSLGEYLIDRGSVKALRRAAARTGSWLAILHQSPLTFARRESAPAREWLRALLLRVGTKLAACEPARPDLVDRFGALVMGLPKEAEFIESRATAPIHGRFGWDCLHYGVDSCFYVSCFETARMADPRLDLGGFLADLLLFSSARGDGEVYAAGYEALHSSYVADGGRGFAAADISGFVVQALIERMDRLLHREDPVDSAALETLLVHAERLQRAPMKAA